MQGVDLSAAAGLRDKVNNHFVRTFGSALLIAAVSAGVQLSQPDNDGTFQSNPTPSQLAAAAVGQELGRVASEYRILIHNTDDHLRNHGFLIGEQGIRLSPAYDIHPSIERRELSLAINDVEATCDPAIAIDACEAYGLTRPEAEGVVKQVRGAVVGWRQQADSLGIPKQEQDLMAAAFET